MYCNEKACKLCTETWNKRNTHVTEIDPWTSYISISRYLLLSLRVYTSLGSRVFVSSAFTPNACRA